MRTTGIKALAAAASLVVLGLATQASATPTPVTLTNAAMDTTYTAVVNVPGEGTVTAYTNGVLFTTSDGDLYGFCIDVFHNMSLGGLDLHYVSNQADGGGLVINPPQGALSDAQVDAITNLVDTGFIMYNNEAPGGFNAAANHDTEERLAAIQSAIWYTESHSYLDPTQFSGLFKTYFDEYAGLNGKSYTSLADANDKVFTISNGANQSFAIGWPIDGVPEPTTWALMLTGFFGMGSILRRQRKAATVTA